MRYSTRHTFLLTTLLVFSSFMLLHGAPVHWRPH